MCELCNAHRDIRFRACFRRERTKQLIPLRERQILSRRVLSRSVSTSTDMRYPGTRDNFSGVEANHF